VNTENEFYQYFVEDYVNEESNINGERENGNVINIMSDDANNKKCIKKKRQKKSKVWDYFEEKATNIYCKVIINLQTETKCGAKYANSDITSTSTLNYHLIHCHQIFVNSEVCLHFTLFVLFVYYIYTFIYIQFFFRKSI
jgi:hypothetical protein